MEKINSDSEGRLERPEMLRESFPVTSVDVTDAFRQMLSELSGQLPKERLSDEERRRFLVSLGDGLDGNECVGALRFAPQVVERTGVTPEQVQEMLARRQTLLLLRDAALRVALGAEDGIVLSGGGGGTAERQERALLDKVRKGKELDPVRVSLALAAFRR